jgi:threonylcarbamoyladenosine tRNA methylthiotransferase MtaB
MKVFFDVVGCRLNQGEVEYLANIFRALDHQIVSNPAEADLAIINSCAVTVKAAADSRKKLRRAARAGAKKVVATGCWATLYPQQASDLEGVTHVFTNEEKDQIPLMLLGLPADILQELRLVRDLIPGERGRTRAFIKVQEGCDNSCTYCLTRLARGKSTSRNLDVIQRDIFAARDGGAKEIVLSGVQLGAWGRDLPNRKNLVDLIDYLLLEGGFSRLRLSSIEPWDFNLEMLPLWRDKRLCRHLHIPLQSGSDQTLHRMGRPITQHKYFDLINTIRERVPQIAITTDVIVGFPGETDEDFQATKNFVQEIGFAGGHVFTYSPRPGTAAFNMKDQIPARIAKGRNRALREDFENLGAAFRKRFIGSLQDVLWESSEIQADGNYRMSGLTDTYLRVFALAKADLWNQISQVELVSDYSQKNWIAGKIL